MVSSFIHYKANGEPLVAGGKGGNCQPAPPPPPPVEPDKSSLWMDLFFLYQSYFDYSDSQLFAIFIFEVDFSETSHDNC